MRCKLWAAHRVALCNGQYVPKAGADFHSSFMHGLGLNRHWKYAHTQPRDATYDCYVLVRSELSLDECTVAQAVAFVPNFLCSVLWLLAGVASHNA